MTWKFEHSMATSAKKQIIWELYSRVESWTIWDHGIESASLEGEFKEGVNGKIKSEGQELSNFKITFADPDKGFSNETIIDNLGAKIEFIHTFSSLADGKTQLTTRIIVDCPDRYEMEKGIGNGLSNGVPETMENLARTAVLIEKICRSG
ncbi:hypothetical protein ACNF42_06755 [Cuniculiplasma sp. SKW3]|uniref:hypothetical protein n=1 Tax=Cuniculiplasma sp. SKW3 TaxID=3400170 RepID=UPI003FD564AD